MFAINQFPYVPLKSINLEGSKLIPNIMKQFAIKTRVCRLQLPRAKVLSIPIAFCDNVI